MIFDNLEHAKMRASSCTRMMSEGLFVVSLMGHIGVTARRIHRIGGYRNSPLPPTRQITSEVTRLWRCSTVPEVSIRLCWAVAGLVRLEVLLHLTIAPLHARRLERSALIPLWGVMVVRLLGRLPRR